MSITINQQRNGPALTLGNGAVHTWMEQGIPQVLLQQAQPLQLLFCGALKAPHDLER